MTPQEIHVQLKKVLDYLSEIDGSETFAQMLADDSFIVDDGDMGHLVHQVEQVLATVNAYLKTNAKSPKIKTYNCSQAVKKAQALIANRKRHILILDTMAKFKFVEFTPPGSYRGSLTEDEIQQVADKLNSY
ncbi:MULTISPECIES: hypothetical protein [unclassified Microcoleus]|uniref:hypothetical protein n=1 Tax=unclassified Microcoleus TaxID=2642155 RepID=UPI002FCEC6CE